MKMRKVIRGSPLSVARCQSTAYLSNRRRNTPSRVGKRSKTITLLQKICNSIDKSFLFQRANIAPSPLAVALIWDNLFLLDGAYP